MVLLGTGNVTEESKWAGGGVDPVQNLVISQVSFALQMFHSNRIAVYTLDGEVPRLSIDFAIRLRITER